MNRPRYILVGQEIVSNGAQRTTVANDDTTGDRLECGTEMLHRFEGNNTITQRVDPKCAKLLEIKHLVRLADDQYVDPANSQDSRWPEIADQPVQHGSEQAERGGQEV